MDRRSLLSPASLLHKAGLITSVITSPLEITPSELSLVHIERRAMATKFEVIFPFSTADAVFIAEECLDLIDQLENQMTAYKERSEISQINVNARHRPVEVEKALFNLLTIAKKLSGETARGFDITSGKLIKLWGFFKGPKRVPSSNDINELITGFDSENLILDPNKKSVFFGKPEIEINLGAIGKGFALDRVKNLLTQRFGSTTFMIQGGKSSILCGNSPCNLPKGWPVAINHPWVKDRNIATIFLKNNAAGISAATYNNFIYKGLRYGHILNPKTGYPASGIATCVAVAQDATTADALSTAFFVHGKELATKYCKNLKETGILILPENDKEDIVIIGNMVVEF